MPTYNFTCEDNHEIEIWCTVKDKPDSGSFECNECGKTMKQFIKEAPHVWSGRTVLDYPGSKRLKAGYQHTHGNVGATKIMSGPGGVVKPMDPLPAWHNPIPGDD